VILESCYRPCDLRVTFKTLNYHTNLVHMTWCCDNLLTNFHFCKLNIFVHEIHHESIQTSRRYLLPKITVYFRCLLELMCSKIFQVIRINAAQNESETLKGQNKVFFREHNYRFINVANGYNILQFYENCLMHVSYCTSG